MTKHSPCRYFKTSPEIIRLAVMLYVRFPLSLHISLTKSGRVVCLHGSILSENLWGYRVSSQRKSTGILLISFTKYFLLLNYRMHPIYDRVHCERRATLRYLVKFQAQIRHLRSGSQYEAAFGLFCDLS
jgi:hypothetical protein